MSNDDCNSHARTPYYYSTFAAAASSNTHIQTLIRCPISLSISHITSHVQTHVRNTMNINVTTNIDPFSPTLLKKRKKRKRKGVGKQAAKGGALEYLIQTKNFSLLFFSKLERRTVFCRKRKEKKTIHINPPPLLNTHLHYYILLSLFLYMLHTPCSDSMHFSMPRCTSHIIHNIACPNTCS
jgi:hypothetical protein